MTEKCSTWCKQLSADFNSRLPYQIKFLCRAANNQVIAEKQSDESLVGKWWRTDIASTVVPGNTCLAPSKKEVLDPEKLDFGGVDPFAI